MSVETRVCKSDLTRYGVEGDESKLYESATKFDPRRFVGRSNVFSLVARKLGDLAKSGKTDYPLLELDGPAGIGKTSVLIAIHNHLAASTIDQPSACVELAGVPPTVSVFADCASTGKTVEEQLHSSLKEKLAALPHIQIGESEGPTIDQNAAILQLKMLGMQKEGRVVVVIDNISELDEERLRTFEDNIISPLIGEKRILVIVAGGRSFIRWSHLETRRRVCPIELDGLSLQETKQMVDFLEGLKEPESEEVASFLGKISYGHPLINCVVLEYLKQKSQDTDKSPVEIIRLAETQTKVGDLVYWLLETHLFKDLKENDPKGELSELLWLASCLRCLNPIPLRKFTSKLFPQEYGSKTGGFYLDAIRDLQTTGLVCWSSDYGGYIFAGPLRRVMTANLAMRLPEESRRRHTEAYQLFDRWCKEFPRSAADYLIEGIYHRCQAGKCAEAGTEFKKGLRELQDNKDIDWDLPYIVVRLEESINNDYRLYNSELEGLLGEQAWKEIVQEAQRFKKQVSES